MPDPLGLAITIDPGAAVGQPLGVRVRLTNLSSGPLWMVGVLEGSERGARYPHYRPTVEGPEPLPPPEIEYDILAPLRLSDFLRLGPGESCDPTDGGGEAAWMPIYAFSSFVPPVPGLYRLGLEVSTLSRDPADWLGGWEAPDRRQALSRVAEVPAVRLDASTSIEVEA